MPSAVVFICLPGPNVEKTDRENIWLAVRLVLEIGNGVFLGTCALHQGHTKQKLNSLAAVWVIASYRQSALN